MRVLDATEKVEAIDRIYQGESKAAVARDIGIPESTLRGWYKSEEKLRALARAAREAAEVAAAAADKSNADTKVIHLVNGNMSGVSSGSSTADNNEGPPAKKPRMDHPRTTSGSCSFNSNERKVPKTHHQANHQQKLEATSMQLMQLMGVNSAVTAGEYNSMFQPYITSAVAKSLLKMGAALPHHNSVNLVENGLHYSKNITPTNMLTSCNTAGGSLNNQNIGKRHNIALAPLQMDIDTNASTKKFCKRAAEPPLNLEPATPKRSNENVAGCSSNNSCSSTNSSGSNNNNNNPCLSVASTSGTCITPSNSGTYAGNFSHGQKVRKDITGVGISSTSTPILGSQNQNISANFDNSQQAITSKAEDNLWNWLNISSHSSDQQLTPLNLSNMSQPSTNSSWIWQGYSRNLGFQTPDIASALGQSQPGSPNYGVIDESIRKTLFEKLVMIHQNHEEARIKLFHDAQRQVESSTSSGNIITTNINSNRNHNNNSSSNTRRSEELTSNALRTKDEAIICCDQLIAWLQECRDPSVTRFQLMQLQSLANKLKNSKIKTEDGLKQRRK
ncbi:hypothetical protein M0802_008491 [Mischocyttarus mexicanus]|nr:hypothetical protein M0802_008491 [Mischocyttarus mexicanus]